MRTKFITTLAVAALITVASTAATLAQGPDVQNSQRDTVQGAVASAHYNPHDLRQR